MDLSNVPPSTNTTDTAAPGPGPWSRRRRLTLGLTALALVAGGSAAIAAGNPDTDPATEPSDAVTAAAKPMPGMVAFGLGGVLHSESVVADGDGGYLTQLTQVGTIESIDADRLTVVSEDGYEQTWNRTSDTVVGGGGWSVSKNDDASYTVRKDTGEPAVGDQVLVVGTVEDGVATAQKIASRPDTGELPELLLKRFEGEFGDRAGAPMLKDRLMKGFEGGDKFAVPGRMAGPMAEPGGEVRRFEFPGPDRAAVPADGVETG